MPYTSPLIVHRTHVLRQSNSIGTSPACIERILTCIYVHASKAGTSLSNVLCHVYQMHAVHMFSVCLAYAVYVTYTSSTSRPRHLTRSSTSYPSTSLGAEHVTGCPSFEKNPLNYRESGSYINSCIWCIKGRCLKWRTHLYSIPD